MKSEYYKIKPRFWPRDIADVFVAFLIGFLFQVGLILILPSLFVFFVVLTTGQGVEISLGCAFATYLSILAVWIAFTVWSLRISDEGMEFTRLLGKPKLLHWNDITDVSEVPRKEVVLKGWLWPMFPCREMTTCLSALRHFRIRWGDNYCYFPPADADDFLKLVSKFRKIPGN
jgi:hypothetical protein